MVSFDSVALVIRRLAVGLAAVTLFSGCTTFSDGDAVARVNDSELSDETLDDLLTLLGDVSSPQGTGINADAARAVISQWVQNETFEQYLDSIGVDTGAARSDFEVALAADPAFTDLSETAQAFLVDSNALASVFEGLPDVQTSLDEALGDADIHVDARYGSFEPSLRAVLPVGVGITTDDF